MNKFKELKGVKTKDVEFCGNIGCCWLGRSNFSYGKCKSNFGECFAYRKVDLD